MPLKCPKCSRTNADAAKTCLYCKTSLQGAVFVEPDEDAQRMAEYYLAKDIPGSKKDKKTEKPGQGMTPDTAVKKPVKRGGKPLLKVIPGGKALIKPVQTPDRFWVIMAPEQTVSSENLTVLSRLLDKDPYYVKQRLIMGNPWVLKRFKEAEKARELAVELRNRGLDVYSLTDTEIGEIPLQMPAHKIFLENEGLKFTHDRETIEMRWPDIVLAVKGRIRRELNSDYRSRRRGAGTLEERGVRPVASKVWEYEVLDIYSKSGKGVRLSERDTNFTGLGEHLTPSSLRNLRYILNVLEEFPTVKIDDGYRRMEKIVKSIGIRGDMVAQKLGRTIEQQNIMEYQDNSEQFGEYSTLVFLHYKKLDG